MANDSKKNDLRAEALDKIKTPVFKNEVERQEFWTDYIASIFIVKILGRDVDDIDEDLIINFWKVYDAGLTFMDMLSKSSSINEFKIKLCKFIDATCTINNPPKGGD